MDDNNHGTHVAGTIAGVGNNNKGIVGVSWNSKIMPLKFINSSGSGYSTHAAQAIIYAVNNGARIINNSWSATANLDQLVKDAIDYAHDIKGAVIVAAAGNDVYVDVYDKSPANINNVITVAAVNENNRSAIFSNPGWKIDVAAPGTNIKSTIISNSYNSFNGTSMATPHISGLAALILSLKPSLTNEEVRQIIKKSCTDDSLVVGIDRYTGSGIVNAYNALNISNVLSVQISNPGPGVNQYDIIDIVGSATGTNFSSYSLSYGTSTNPSAWYELTSSTQPIASGTIYTMNTNDYEDGVITLYLKAVDSLDEEYEFRSYIKIQNNPGVPENFTAHAFNGFVNLTWSTSTVGKSSIDGYEIYRATSSGEYFGILATTTILTYIDNTVENGETYYYKIRAYDASNPIRFSNYTYESQVSPGLVWPIQRVSVGISATEPNAECKYSGITGNGKYVYFSSSATNIIQNDVNGYGDEFLWEAKTGLIISVSMDSFGNQIASSSSGKVSDDKRYFVFSSRASNLVVGDSNNSNDIFVKDLQTGLISLVSSNFNGDQGEAASYFYDASNDGRYILFSSESTNLVQNDNNGYEDLFLKDIQTGSTSLVTVNLLGEQLEGWIWNARVSSDGKYVAMNYYLATADWDRAFLKNMETGAFDMVDTDSLGNEIIDAGSYNVAATSDGRYVVFNSYSEDITLDVTNYEELVYIKDTLTGTTSLVASDKNGNPGNGTSQIADISDDGKYVVFESSATNLVPNDNNAKIDVFLKNIQTGEIVRFSTDSMGNEANHDSRYQEISKDGRYLIFASLASNLVSGDNGGFADVFIRPNNQYTVSEDNTTKYAGESFDIRTVNLDIFGNNHENYEGPLTITSSDPRAVLPTDDQSGWNNGEKSFGITLNTPGIHTISISDSNTNLSSTTITITVATGTLNHIVFSPSIDQTATTGQNIQFTAQGQDIANNDIPNLIYTWTNADANGIFNNENPGVYLVKATNNGIDSPEIQITVLNNAKEITSFTFENLTPTTTGIINENNKTVSFTVSMGTDVASLTPTIAHTGSSTSPLSGALQDFTSPVNYTVTAEDGSTQNYVVTVNIDSTIPTAILSNVPSNNTTSGSTNITVGGEDVIYYKYKLDSGSFSSETSTTTNIVLSGLPVGWHTVYVLARDITGNWQSLISATSFIWMISAPITPSSGGGGSSVYAPKDTTAPGAPTNFSVISGDRNISFSWNNPLEDDFEGTTLLRTNYLLNLGRPASEAIASGTVIYRGKGNSYTDTGLTAGNIYYYAIFSYDKVQNYSSILTKSSTPYALIDKIADKLEPVVEKITLNEYQEIKNLFGQESKIVERVTSNEANQVLSQNSIVNLDEISQRLLEKINIRNVEITEKNQIELSFFINDGTLTTKILGKGERAGVLNSYKEIFGKFPESEDEWKDIIKIANGRWPNQRNEKKENEIKEKIFKRCI